MKNTAFRTGFTEAFGSVASREVLDKATPRRRLLLCLFALGTNMGIRQMAATGEHGENESTLRHVRATYITRENLRAAIATVVNATLEARDPAWWGEATSTASDSKRFGSWDSNLMTEFKIASCEERLEAEQAEQTHRHQDDTGDGVTPPAGHGMTTSANVVPLAAAITLGEAAEQFLTRRDLKADTLRSYGQMLRRLRRELGDTVPLAQLTADQAATVFTAPWDEAAPRTWEPSPLGTALVHHLGRRPRPDHHRPGRAH